MYSIKILLTIKCEPYAPTITSINLYESAVSENSLALVISCGILGARGINRMENDMLRLIRDLKSDKKGVTMIEYALIAGLISVVAIALLSAMGNSVKNLFGTINTALTTA